MQYSPHSKQKKSQSIDYRGWPDNKVHEFEIQLVLP